MQQTYLMARKAEMDMRNAVVAYGLALMAVVAFACWYFK